jgi:hypothetical protein
MRTRSAVAQLRLRAGAIGLNQRRTRSYGEWPAGPARMVRAHTGLSAEHTWGRLVTTGVEVASGRVRVDALNALLNRRRLTVSMTGPSYVDPNTSATWYVAGADGSAPYAYNWYKDGAWVGAGDSYSGDTGAAGYELQVSTTDAAGATHVSTMNVVVGSGCGTRLVC